MSINLMLNVGLSGAMVGATGCIYLYINIYI